MTKKNDSPKLAPDVEIVYSLKFGGEKFFAWVVMPRTRFWGALSRSLVSVARFFRKEALLTEALLLRPPTLPLSSALAAWGQPQASSSDETWNSGFDLPN